MFLLGPDGCGPIPVTSQHLLLETYLDPTQGRAYTPLKKGCRDLILTEWKDTAHPTPYGYPPSLKPHPFMGLNKVDAC